MYKYIRLTALLLIDAILVTCSVYMAFLLRFDFAIPREFTKTFDYIFILFTATILGSFYLFKIYKRIWQYASVGDLIAIMKGAFLGTGASFIFHHEIVHQYYPLIVIPRSIYPLSIIVSFMAIGASRLIWRLLRDNYGRITPNHRKALIVGAGEAGVMVVKELRRTESKQYPIAFIDDNLQKQHYEVMGVPVVGTRYDIANIVKHYKVDDIIVAIPTASRTDISEIIAISKDTGCQIKIVPRMNDLINGSITINTIRDVSVEDLLGRDPIQLDVQSVAGYLSGRTVLITGAGGSIGSELCRQIMTYKPSKLVLVGHGENSIYDIDLELRKKYKDEIKIISCIADVQDKQRLSNIFAEHHPNVVFHAAAHKHVPLMESNPLEAVKNNILGTRNVAECAHEHAADRFVMVSTDKAVNPTNVMGATKRAAEMVVQSLDQVSETCFASVRFGNVLGSRGSVIPIFKQQIEEGGPVTVTHPEMIRYFMTIPEAVQLVIQAGALATGGEVFILDMGKPVKIVDLARDLIRLSGLEPDKDIEITYTGIRPGEKLFEELLTSEEGTTGTKFDRIYIGKPIQTPYDEIKLMLQQFEYLALRKELPTSNEVKLKLKEWVPTYQGTASEPTVERQPVIGEAYFASREIVAALDHK